MHCPLRLNLGSSARSDAPGQAWPANLEKVGLVYVYRLFGSCVVNASLT